EAIDLALVDAGVLERQTEGLRRQRERRLIRQLALPRGSDSDNGRLPPGHSFPLEYGLALLAERPTPFIAVLAERQLVEQLALEVEGLGPLHTGRHTQRTLGGDHRERSVACNGARMRHRGVDEPVR